MPRPPGFYTDRAGRPLPDDFNPQEGEHLMHPKLPFGLGSQITLTGLVGAVVAFIYAWSSDGLTPETVTLGATAGGLLAAFFAGRSVQAKSAIDAGIKGYAGEVINPDEGDADSAPLPPG